MRRRLAILIAVFTITTTVAQAAPLYDVATDAAIRSTVLFIGDSNITRGATEITQVLTVRVDGAHLPVLGSKPGMGVRGYGPECASAHCASSEYWALRIPQMLASVTPSVIVVNLGINDALAVGTPTSVGYGAYAAKIDWLMSQVPATVAVLWTNLPCALEPTNYVTGCKAINTQLNLARPRHPNLTVLNWNSIATNHHEYMGGAGVAPHYTSAGYAAWAKFVNTALDSRFPVTPTTTTTTTTAPDTTSTTTPDTTTTTEAV
jgi:hypothetical protein